MGFSLTRDLTHVSCRRIVYHWVTREAPCIFKNSTNIYELLLCIRASLVAQLVKNTSANAGKAGYSGSIPGSGRSLGGGNGNPLQYSCLENLMDRGAWWATVHGVTKSQTWLNVHAHMHALGISHWSIMEWKKKDAIPSLIELLWCDFPLFSSKHASWIYYYWLQWYLTT